MALPSVKYNGQVEADVIESRLGQDETGREPGSNAAGEWRDEQWCLKLTCMQDFRERHRILTTRLLKQGYKYDQLCSYFKRFSSKYKDIFAKFKIGLKQHIKGGALDRNRK